MSPTPTTGFKLKSLPTKSVLFTLYKIMSAVPIAGSKVIKLGCGVWLLKNIMECVIIAKPNKGMV